MVVIGQRTDWQLLALSSSPEVVAGANSNAGEPMFERDRSRELRQPDVRSDKHIVGDLFGTIRWHSPIDDADDVALVSANQIGIAINLPAPNTLKDFPIVWLALETC
jgi:hypothetical protein